RQFPIYGVQFHPESIMTPCGKQMLLNFIKS
ncbi:MAG: aminodeoxychorismate/anthranilate synthase component II, partial [Lachnospiraceae bacterium]|nr:aminodeoxychorismate/anthranilate synthase component II [Lachnospiraceae bacterium]